MPPPTTTHRTPEQIVKENLYFDSAGYMFRAMSWLEYSADDVFPSLIYSSIEARLGIEHLLFEELVISTGANLTKADYERLLRDGKLEKAIQRLSPDYQKLQEFTLAIVSVEPRAPRLITWDIRELMKGWGKLSAYLHWTGARTDTVEDPAWSAAARTELDMIIRPIWDKLMTAQSGIMHPSQMHLEVRAVWTDFRDGKIDISSVKTRLEILRPVLLQEYA